MVRQLQSLSTLVIFLQFFHFYCLLWDVTEYKQPDWKHLPQLLRICHDWNRCLFCQLATYKVVCSANGHLLLDDARWSHDDDHPAGSWRFFTPLRNTRKLGRHFLSMKSRIYFMSIPHLDMPGVVQVCAMGGKIGVSCSFGIFYLFFTELIPTAVRNMGLGVITMVSHIGTIICPYILYLGMCTLDVIRHTNNSLLLAKWNTSHPIMTMIISIINSSNITPNIIILLLYINALQQTAVLLLCGDVVCFVLNNVSILHVGSINWDTLDHH